MRLLINNEESIDTARVRIYKCTKCRGRRARVQKIHRVTFSLSNFVQDRPFTRGQTLGLRYGFLGRFYKIRSLLMIYFFDKTDRWVKIAGYCKKLILTICIRNNVESVITISKSAIPSSKRGSSFPRNKYSVKSTTIVR